MVPLLLRVSSGVVGVGVAVAGSVLEFVVSRNFAPALEFDSVLVVAESLDFSFEAFVDFEDFVGVFLIISSKGSTNCCCTRFSLAFVNSRDLMSAVPFSSRLELVGVLTPPLTLLPLLLLLLPLVNGLVACGLAVRFFPVAVIDVATSALLSLSLSLSDFFNLFSIT